jgi:membrane protease YdiL (CAAX protease family)
MSQPPPSPTEWQPPRPPAPAGPSAPSPPGPADGWLALPAWVPFATLVGGTIATLLIGSVVAGIVFAATGSAKGSMPAGLTIGLTVVQDVLFVAAAVYATQLVLKRVSPRQFGLRTTPLSRGLGWIIAVYAAYWVFSSIVLVIFGKPPEQQIVTDLKDTQSTAVIVGFAVLTCAIAPIAEEFFFRGFMFNTLAGRIGVGWATVITGVVFGLIHFTGSSWIGVLVLGFFGMGLCVLFWRTQSLLPCMALHALNNAISFGYTKDWPAVAVVALVAGSVGVAVGAGTWVSRLAAT